MSKHIARMIAGLLVAAAPLAAQDATACEAPARMYSGRVIHGVSGVALPGASVALTDRSGTSISETPTDAEGRYRLCVGSTAVRRLTASVFGLTGSLEVDGELPTSGLDLFLQEAGDNDGRLVGQITDRATGRPVQSASISIDGDGRSVLSNNGGAFAISALRPGKHHVRVTHLGYGAVDDTVTIPANRTVEFDVHLSPDPVELEPIIVSTVMDRRLEIKGFYERRRWGAAVGNGIFLDRAEIDNRAASRVSHLIQGLPGSEVRCSRSGYCRVRFRRAPPWCESAAILLDGMRFSNIDQIMLAEIGGIEIYRGASELPAELGGSDVQCGVIAVWTRGG